MKKNTATKIVFPILDADGDLVGGATALDSEYSLDGGVFTDCTNEATDITSAAVNTGIYYLNLLAGETNGDVVCIQVKTTTSGAKTTVLVFYTATQTLDETDAICDAVKAKTDLIGASVALESGGNIAAILADTNELQTDWVNGGRLDLLVDAILADSNELQTDWVNGGRLDLLLDSAISKIDAVDDYVDTEIAAIKAVTDTLSLAAIADAVHDEVTEGTTTLRKAVKLICSALFAKTSGGGTATLIARDIGDTKARITVTADADGNRTAVILDGA